MIGTTSRMTTVEEVSSQTQSSTHVGAGIALSAVQPFGENMISTGRQHKRRNTFDSLGSGNISDMERQGGEPGAKGGGGKVTTKSGGRRSRRSTLSELIQTGTTDTSMHMGPVPVVCSGQLSSDSTGQNGGSGLFSGKKSLKPKWRRHRLPVRCNNPVQEAMMFNFVVNDPEAQVHWLGDPPSEGAVSDGVNLGNMAAADDGPAGDGVEHMGAMAVGGGLGEDEAVQVDPEQTAAGAGAAHSAISTPSVQSPRSDFSSPNKQGKDEPVSATATTPELAKPGPQDNPTWTTPETPSGAAGGVTDGAFGKLGSFGKFRWIPGSSVIPEKKFKWMSVEPQQAMRKRKMSRDASTPTPPPQSAQGGQPGRGSSLQNPSSATNQIGGVGATPMIVDTSVPVSITQQAGGWSDPSLMGGFMGFIHPNVYVGAAGIQQSAYYAGAGTTPGMGGAMSQVSVSPWDVFCRIVLERHRLQFPYYPPPTQQQLFTQWKALSDEERQRFREMADEEVRGWSFWMQQRQAMMLQGVPDPSHALVMQPVWDSSLAGTAMMMMQHTATTQPPQQQWEQQQQHHQSQTQQQQQQQAGGQESAGQSCGLFLLAEAALGPLESRDAKEAQEAKDAQCVDKVAEEGKSSEESVEKERKQSQESVVVPTETESAMEAGQVAEAAK